MLQKGDRIKLLAMPDDAWPIEQGGTVERTLDWGDGRRQISVKWDNGRSLALVVPPNRFRLIGKENASQDFRGTSAGSRSRRITMRSCSRARKSDSCSRSIRYLIPPRLLLIRVNPMPIRRRPLTAGASVSGTTRSNPAGRSPAPSAPRSPNATPRSGPGGREAAGSRSGWRARRRERARCQAARRC